MQVAGQRRGLGGHAFHQVAVADKGPGAVVDRHMSALVVARRQMRFGNRHADGIGHALAQRAGGDLDTRCVAALRMPGCLAAPLPELFQVVQRQVIAGDMQQAVEQGTAMPGRQHEAVAVGPQGVGRMVLQMAGPQRIRHGGRAQRQARVPAVGMLHHVNRQKAQGVDALKVERSGHG